jgi:hypothetical protein
VEPAPAGAAPAAASSGRRSVSRPTFLAGLAVAAVVGLGAVGLIAANQGQPSDTATVGSPEVTDPRDGASGPGDGKGRGGMGHGSGDARGGDGMGRGSHHGDTGGDGQVPRMDGSMHGQRGGGGLGLGHRGGPEDGTTPDDGAAPDGTAPDDGTPDATMPQG